MALSSMYALRIFLAVSFISIIIRYRIPSIWLTPMIIYGSFQDSSHSPFPMEIAIVSSFVISSP